MILYTALYTSPYDGGFLFVGTFFTKEEAKKALVNIKVKSDHVIFDVPVIVEHTVGEIVDKCDYERCEPSSLFVR